MASPGPPLATFDDDSYYVEGDGHALFGRGLLTTYSVDQAEMSRCDNEPWPELQSGNTAAFVTLPIDRRKPALVRIPKEIAWSGRRRSVGLSNSTALGYTTGPTFGTKCCGPERNDLELRVPSLGTDFPLKSEPSA